MKGGHWEASNQYEEVFIGVLAPPITLSPQK